jgi:hypothetical protein
MKIFHKLLANLAKCRCHHQIAELEKEVAFWKEKALNYRKPHGH